MRLCWTFEEVDSKLQEHHGEHLPQRRRRRRRSTACPGNLVAGANIAGFLKVADAMLAYGLV